MYVLFTCMYSMKLCIWLMYMRQCFVLQMSLFLSHPFACIRCLCAVYMLSTFCSNVRSFDIFYLAHLHTQTHGVRALFWFLLFLIWNCLLLFRNMYTHTHTHTRRYTNSLPYVPVILYTNILNAYKSKPFNVSQLMSDSYVCWTKTSNRLLNGFSD